ncbi:T3SS effector HopA1 family protein [Rathayibacter tanaceti]|uniref:Uncharacterized protein n=2 Tax=Rathayibacter tanaceti TaxID=1671680 RepID=A0A162FYB9_9MICO|nr:T3SS effector HopA1 family protein [Rathayibacter tanaceti]KZX21360.1 hypothetical protein ACH61_01502 [Rathayibacter tanaceti]QHC54387.1 hypothetical protein GSU10_01040 [Rathayibacter tanaceti]TCO38071.1 hypothetical protein EV639_103258 [Rathayibacter tanaceti]
MSAPALAPTEQGLASGVSWILSRIGIADDQRSARAFGTEIETASASELGQVLARRIYQFAHAGIGLRDDAPGGSLTSEDRVMEERIASATARRARAARVPLLETVPQYNGVVVLHQSLRVFVPDSRVLDRTSATAHIALNSLATRLSVGFSFFTSSAGAGSRSRPLRLYRAAADADDALDAWGRLTERLESAHVPARAKILSSSEAYPRTDAIVLYLPQESWERVREFADLLASDDPRAGTSVLAGRLAPGVGYAWEPDDPARSRRTLSFGEHRAETIAKALVEPGGEPAAERVRLALLAANIHPLRVHENLDSPRLPG